MADYIDSAPNYFTAKEKQFAAVLKRLHRLQEGLRRGMARSLMGNYEDIDAKSICVIENQGTWSSSHQCSTELYSESDNGTYSHKSSLTSCAKLWLTMTVASELADGLLPFEM